MDLKQLQYLLVTIEHRSFARAAKILHISQPALSKAVKRLEESLGVPLLERLPRGVRPTLYGEALAAHASLINNEVERAADAIVALRDGNTGRVVVGAGSSMRIELLPEAVVQLRQRRPDVQITMVGELYDDLLPDLKKGELDLTISMLPEHNTDYDVEQIPLYVDKTHPTVRKNHPLTRKKTLTARDCLEYDWILPTQDNLGRRHLDAFLLSQGYATARPVIETNSTLFALSIMRKSDLIGWHPTQIVGDVKRTGLVALPIDTITLTRVVGIRFHRASVLNPATLLLIEELKKVTATMIAQGVVMPLQAAVSRRIMNVENKKTGAKTQ